MKYIQKKNIYILKFLVIFAAVFISVFMFSGKASAATISGTLYGTDELTPVATTPNVSISVNGAAASTVAANGSGVFSFGSVTVSSGDIVTIWISGATEKGSLVFRYGSSCTGHTDCTGLRINRDQVILDSKDGGYLTTTNLAGCDNDTGTGCNTTDIGFTSNSGTITLASGRTLRMRDSTAYFLPTGNVVADVFNQTGGTTTASTADQTITISGNMTIGSGGMFQSTSTEVSITVGGDLSVDGTLSGSGNLTVNGGDATGSGTIIFISPDTDGTYLKNIKELSTNGGIVCAVTNDGNLYCWGNYTSGNGTGNTYSIPIKVIKGEATGADTDGTYLTNIKQVSTSSQSVCSVAYSGNVYCWGSMANGVLGNNIEDYNDTYSPIKVLKGAATVADHDGTYLTNISYISTNSFTTCAVSVGGNAYCWGLAFWGALGNNGDPEINILVPGRVLKGAADGADNDGTYLTNIAKIYVGNVYTCAVSVGGNAYCWGNGSNGKLGNNDTTDLLVPGRVLKGAADGADNDGTYLTNIASISTGNFHTCAVSAGGNAYCWGAPGSGRLGDGTTSTDKLVPVRVLKGADGSTNGSDTDGTNLINISSISAGSSHTCAISIGGRAYCWGAPGSGRLGNGTTSGNKTTPVRVLQGADGNTSIYDTDGVYLINMANIFVNITSSVTCATSSSSGNAYCWGAASGSLLGDGQISTNRTTPVRVLKGEAGSLASTTAVTINGTGSFGGNNAWTFVNLVFGGTTSGTGSGTIFADTMNITSGDTLNASSLRYVIGGTGSPFTIGGIFNANSSTFIYAGGTTGNISPATYNNLYILASTTGSIDGGSGATYKLGTSTGQVIRAANLVFGDTSHYLHVDGAQYGATLEVTGDFTISSNTLYTAAPATIFKKSGTQTFTNNTYVTSQEYFTPEEIELGNFLVGFNSGYSYYRAITINSQESVEKSESPYFFTDFPVLVNGTYSYLKATSTGGRVHNMNGYDVAFSLEPSCATKLSWETEKYASTTGEVAYWVKIPKILSEINTTLYMCYGSTTASTDQSNRTAVWGSDYAGVYHFTDGTTLSANDSTSNANNGTKNGSPAAASGYADGGANFSGSSQNISISSISLANKRWAVSAMIHLPLASTADWNTLLRGVNADHQIIVRRSDNHLGSYLNAGGFQDSGIDLDDYSTGWHHLHVFSPADGSTIFTIDGSPYTIGAASVSEITYIGNYQGGSQQWGMVDELQIFTDSNTGSYDTFGDSEWVAAYRNSFATSTFYSIGTEQSTSNSTGATLNLGSSATTTSVIVNSSNTLSLNGSNTLTLTNSGVPFIINGTFTPSTGSVDYTGFASTTISAGTYYTLGVYPSDDDAVHTFASGTFTIDGNLNVGTGNPYVASSTVRADINNTILDVAGDFTNNPTSFFAHSSNSFTVGGSWYGGGYFINNSGTVTMDGTGSKVFDSRSNAFYNLTFNGSGSTWNGISDINTVNLTMTAGTLTGSKNIYASGNVSGNGTINYTSDTQDTTNLSNIIQISSSTSFSCGVSVNYKLYCWYHSGYGDQDEIPTQVLAGEAVGADTDGTYLINVKQVSVGATFGDNACAVTNAGNVYCWGSGYLGNGESSLSATPIRVLKGAAAVADHDGTYLTNIKQISATYGGVCTLSNGGNVYCWGDNYYGQLGNNETENYQTLPVRVLKGAAAVADHDGVYLNNIKQVSLGNNGFGSGGSAGCAVSNGGNVYCWGNYMKTGHNQICCGVYPTPVRPIGWAPETVINGADTDGSNLINISSVSVGQNTVCATSNSGHVYCWGNGTLGDGGTGNYVYPRHVLKGEAASTDNNGTYLTNMSTVTQGGAGACGVSNGGNVYCWGDGFYYANGRLDRTFVTTPVRVQKGQTGNMNYLDTSGNYLSNITQITRKGDYINGDNERVCALSNTGNVYCWGSYTNRTPDIVRKGTQSLADSGTQNNELNMSGIANLGGTTDWIFGNITFNGTTTATGNFESTGDLIINQYKKLDGSNKSVTVGRSWINNGTFASSTSAVIVSPNGTTTTFAGTTATDFYNFRATTTNAAKNIRFTEGLNFKVYNSMQLNGLSGSPIYLNSTSTTNQWTLFVSNLATLSNSYLYVKNSACGGGSSTIYAGQNSVNDGNNGACWSFAVMGGSSATGVSLGGESGGGTPVGGGDEDGGGGSSDGGSGGGNVYTASADFSSTQGYRNWYYQGGAGSNLTYHPTGGDCGDNMWGTNNLSYLCVSASAQHPDNVLESVRRWVSPAVATITIVGSVQDTNTSCGDGVTAYIRKNGSNIWTQVIANVATVYNYNESVSVTTSDTIDFVVNSGSNRNCDSTNFDPTITVTLQGGGSGGGGGASP